MPIMNEYYVYGLIDPRTNSIFYIGKGKGKRVFQHFKEKEDYHTNSEKLKLIAEIQKEGQQVNHIFIGENLKEETALLLEKLLIYRIGRKIFNEGCLTNIVPGGRWNSEASYFLSNEDLPSIEAIKSQYPDLISVLEKFPKISKEFSGLQDPNNSENKTLYIYEKNGTKLYDWDIDYLIKLFGLSSALEIINTLKDTVMPVYARGRLWSKINHEKLEDISKIPFQEMDIIDFGFVKQINNVLVKKNNLSLKCLFPDGKIHNEIVIISDSNEITLTSYYLNGNKKHITSCIEGKLNGKCRSWHANGQLKEEMEYILDRRISKTCYFPSGVIQMIENYNNEGNSVSVKTWYDNEQLCFESNENGLSYSYSLAGKIISKSIRSGDLHNGGHLLAWEYSEDGKVKKEIKSYYLNHLLHGYEKSYYDTGELRREVDYTNGPDNKIIKLYKKNGEETIKKT
ncbi:MAG TPA: hypothetical protein PKH58_09915 [Paludibacteraceae bacterium]|nr:hypothetical protein [Paludibacteraceae bacterium]